MCACSKVNFRHSACHGVPWLPGIFLNEPSIPEFQPTHFIASPDTVDSLPMAEDKVPKMYGPLPNVAAKTHTPQKLPHKAAKKLKEPITTERTRSFMNFWSQKAISHRDSNYTDNSAQGYVYVLHTGEYIICTQTGISSSPGNDLGRFWYLLLPCFTAS